MAFSTTSKMQAEAASLSIRMESTPTPNLINKLQCAIMAGDEEQARYNAGLLARQQTRLQIHLDKSPAGPSEQEVRTKVYIEDKTDTGAFIWMNLRPSMTIKELKKKILLEYGFPTEVQNWIIGRRIGKDSETLARLNIRSPGETIYLYLVSAKSVNLTRQEYRNRFNGQLWPDEKVLEEFESHCNNSDYSGSSRTLPNTRTGRLQTQLRELPHVVRVAGEAAESAPLLEASLMQTSPAKKQTGVQPEHIGQTLPQTPNQLSEPKQIGWECPACTFINEPSRPGCKICAEMQPADYQIPADYEMSPEEVERIKREKQLEDMVKQEEENKRQVNLHHLIEVDELDIVPNREEFLCNICFENIQPGNGVRLRECLHMFCKDCLTGQIEYCETAAVECPFQDENYICGALLQDREVRALVNNTLYEKVLQRSLVTAESSMDHSYHCKTPDCKSFCIYEDNVNFFYCPACGKNNCLTCKAIHEGMNCEQYQKDLERRAAADLDAQKTQETIKLLLEKGDAMKCPKCCIILQKKDGCDWLQCTMCKTEICWVTKGPRWGPLGVKDISGGCRCGVNGEQCHPNCHNCH